MTSGRYGFRYEAVRRALAASLTPGRRQVLSRLVAAGYSLGRGPA
jgi:hypothetical protein